MTRAGVIRNHNVRFSVQSLEFASDSGMSARFMSRCFVFALFLRQYFFQKDLAQQK